MKRFFKILGWSVLGLASTLLLVFAAWVASNWNDVEPQPRPAVLALPAPQLPDEVNSFDALIKLSDGLAKPVQAALLSCNAPQEDCVGQWTKNLKALADARQAMAAFGARCDVLAGEQFEYEEKIPAFARGKTETPLFSDISFCSNWWLSAGVQAWAEGNPVAALAALLQSDRYQRALLAGSHSLIGVSRAVDVSQRHLQVLAGLAVRDPSFATAVLPMLAPLPNAAAAAKRWMVYASAADEAMFEHIWQYAASSETDDQVSWWTRWLQRRGIGFQRERTLQQARQKWQTWLTELDSGLPAAIRAHQARNDAANKRGLWGAFTWRNTQASVLLSVAEPSYVKYLARQADLDLLRELVQLAVAAQAQGIEPAKRAAWSQSQTISPEHRDRIVWSADGNTLSANTWRGEIDPATAQNSATATIRIQWPAATNR